MAHRVQPYYVREPQGWAIEQERRRHNQALWYLGEHAMFALMWHLEDFEAGLVERCPVCFVSQGPIADVYGQADEHDCLSCFGTTFDGGFKALIVRPAIFSDADESETRHARGVVQPSTLTIDSTPDFRVRTGDYAFRRNGDRFYLRVPERITLRTGFGSPTQAETAIAYNHANAAQEDATSASYLIPPGRQELAAILGLASRIPRPWTDHEVIRAPLIPTEETTPTLTWSTPIGGTVMAGPPGPQGPSGPQGLSGGSYTHTQFTASNTWIIVHPLGYQPAGVRVLDSAGTEVEGIVSYPAPDQVRIDFAVPFGGTAYLS